MRRSLDRARRRAAALALVAALTAPAGAAAQSAVSVELGWLGAPGGRVVQVGLRAATRALERVGVDGAVAFVPRAGTTTIVTDVALSFPVGTGVVFVAPRVGASVLGSGGAVPGVHVGAGIVARVAGGLGLRVDYTHRFLFHGFGWLGVSSMTAGLTLLQ